MEPTADFALKSGLAEMLKGGVIVDVIDAEQACTAERAGACAVMALERVPADIRREGGVARMATFARIREVIPTANPTHASISWYAVQLRKKGYDIPFRRRQKAEA